MKHSILKYTVLFLSLFIVINNYIFLPGNILSWDVFGYYLYLPLKFIYNDLGMTNDQVIFSIIEKYKNTSTFYQGMRFEDGHYVMKYSMGLSFFYAPFFFIGHGIAKIFGYPVDGFSAPYQFSIFIGCIIYTLLGIHILSKVLSRFFIEKVSALVLIIIVFATNYVIHNTMYGQNAMSHNILFTAYACILWLTILWHDKQEWKHAVLLAIICGLTILSRPSEIVCLIIPALWSISNKTSLNKKLELLLKFKMQVLVFGIILMLLGSAQFVYWKIYTGKFIFNSYGGNPGEGFEFLSPYIINVLFSFRKGWYIYTPIMLIATSGLYFLFKKNKDVFLTFLIFFTSNVFIISSWSCWWYAQSFSQRPMVSMYPIMAILLGYVLQWVSEQQKLTKFFSYLLVTFCLLLNVFQTFQFHKGILNNDRMTKAAYMKIFGKVKLDPEVEKLLLINRSFDGSDNIGNSELYQSTILQYQDFEEGNNIDSTIFHSGKFSFRLDSTILYSPNIEKAYSRLTEKDHAWINIIAYVYPTDSIALNPFSLVVHFLHNNYPYNYRALDFEKQQLKINEWNKITFNYLTPEVRKTSDKLKLFFWNRGKSKVYIDDVKVSVLEKKD